MPTKDDNIRALSDALISAAAGLSGGAHGAAIGLCIELLGILFSRGLLSRSDLDALIGWAEAALAEAKEGRTEAGEDLDALARTAMASAALRSIIDALRSLRHGAGGEDEGR